ncbi:Flavodoxin [Poriferisphaera corsica]|uniref:Flavodoxin n=1 Tax=Poriferisphaera corsica TaxID=2528020 RepID=A0A517YSD3_9BACT|nr:flavodoxin [Poriferisphaera corsica]QDU33121.1 Flavodoxin [Poriferisphaera corsica]
MKITIIYGSSTGNTQNAAEIIADELTNLNADYQVEVLDVCDATPEQFNQPNLLIAGISTWDIGELQCDWFDAYEQLDDTDLSGSTFALFGLGDAGAYSDTYQDAMGILHDKLLERGAKAIGYWPTENYIYDDSRAVIDGNKFCGLALDEEGESDKTEERIIEWVKQVSKELELVKQHADASSLTTSLRNKLA